MLLGMLGVWHSVHPNHTISQGVGCSRGPNPKLPSEYLQASTFYCSSNCQQLHLGVFTVSLINPSIIVYLRTIFASACPAVLGAHSLLTEFTELFTSNAPANKRDLT